MTESNPKSSKTLTERNSSAWAVVQSQPQQFRAPSMAGDNQSVASHTTAGHDSTSPKAITLDMSKVLKHGYLMKKGRFYGQKKRYFYLEEPCFLKYGDKEGTSKVRKCIDLCKGEGEQDVFITESKGKIKNFKLRAVDPETNKIATFRLKADNKVERDEWVEYLKKVLLPYSKKMASNGSNEMQFEEQKSSLVKQMSHLQQHNSKLKTITLNQISEQILKSKENLNSKINAQDIAFIYFKGELTKLHQDPSLPTQYRDRVTKILDLANNWQTEQKSTFEFLQVTTKNLHVVVENIAQKEIEKNPIDFIRRESFQVGGHEEFYSMNGDDLENELDKPQIIPEDEDEESDDDEDEEEEEEEDNEYHVEENAVAKRLKPYRANDTSPPQKDEQINTSSAPPKNAQQKDKQYSHSKNHQHHGQGTTQEGIKRMEEVFYDAKDDIMLPSDSIQRANSLISQDKQQSMKKNQIVDEEEENKQLISKSHSQEDEEIDPPERFVLPFFKDPKLKISVWTILKDSIGKDITKMSVPVYFNDPMNILQKCATSMEYVDLLDQAVASQDSLKRLAIVSAYVITNLTCLEKNSTKPFNPLLGETFELVTPKYRFLAEQVSHHPPITALDCQGKTGYHVWSCNRGKTKFNGRNLIIQPTYKYYVEMGPAHNNETYEIILPTISAHNLVIGTPYLDLGGTSTIKNLQKPNEYCNLEFHKRGWSESSYYKVDGEIFNNGNGKKGGPVYRIEGKWSESAVLINEKTKEKEVLWSKSPYPEQWELMYGMSQFMLQLNYFPKQFRKVIAPTDTRWRPDQRALENGDMKLAADEKNRLEEKQRAVRKYNEKHNIEHKPSYFDEWKNPDDEGQIYFRYNGKYWEHDWLKKDWTRLPDLYSENLDTEIAAMQRTDTQQSEKNK